MSEDARRAVVIGGGITGLSAAYEFHRAGWTVDVFEASDRWGGKILTSPVGEQPGAPLVDAGPDAVLMRAEAGRELVDQLGLTEEMTHPIAPKPAYLFLDGRLHVLPGGTVLGVPVDPAALDHTDLITDAGRTRAAQDLTMPPSDLSDDVTIGSLCRERLGDELTDRLIDPLVGGINASNIDRLSLQAAAPLLAQAMTEHGSLMRGLGKMYPEIGAALGGDRNDSDAPRHDRRLPRAATRPPVFFSLAGGVGRIIERLVETLPADGLHLDHPIGALAGIPDLTTADAVVVATPARAAARLLDDVPAAVAHLTDFPYATVSQATVVIPGQPPLDAAGILFPRVGGTMLTASTWLSSKWPHYQADDQALIRLTSGRYGDERTAHMDDGTVAATLLDELDRAVPLVAEPSAVRIQRWPNALPQYEPGHLDRIAEVRADLVRHHPRIRLAGAAYDGIGIPACIAGGRRAARELLA